LADAQFVAGQTADLPKLRLQLRELKVDDIELETGRPRTDAYIVYLFLMLRGFNGGCKDQHARLLLKCSHPHKLQELADSLTAHDLSSCGQKWLACLTPFFKESERKEAGCQHRLFFSQVEYCDNLKINRRSPGCAGETPEV
jgi:hypothetical protein